jgi:hypothetical protein
MKSINFQIVYDGPALEANEMDVYDLAPALLAVGQLMEETGKILYGEKFKIGVNVSASFKTGCFGIQLSAISNDFVDIFSNNKVVAIGTCLSLLGFSVKDAGKSIISFILWLKNRRITKTIKLKDSDNVQVYVDQDHFIIEERVLAMLKSRKIRESLEKIITKPLSRQGIQTFAVTDVENIGHAITTVSKEESIYFSVPDVANEKLTDNDMIVSLQIINACFQDGNKWKFTDGSQSFFAEILDKNFINKVNNSEAVFAKDDILKVKINLTQWLTDSGIKPEYTIIEVLDHRSGQRQIDIFNPEN